MKKLLSGIAVGASLMFAAGGALADGLPYGRGLKEVGGCSARFHGFYFGAHGGYAYGTAHQNDLDAYLGEVAGYTASDSGFVGGGQAGYNWQGCHTLFGVEADWTWANLDATTRMLPNTPGIDLHVTSSLGSFGTLRTRSGLVFENLLLYLTGGIAFADMDHSIRNRDPAVPINEQFSFSDMRVGWTAGFGTEWAVGSNVSIKSEVLYMAFGDNNDTLVSPALGATPFSFKFDDSAWVSRIGVNIKLGN